MKEDYIVCFSDLENVCTQSLRLKKIPTLYNYEILSYIVGENISTTLTDRLQH